MSENKANENKEILKKRLVEYLNETIKQVENDETEYVLVLKSVLKAGDSCIHPVTCFLRNSGPKMMAAVMGYLDLMKNELIEHLTKD
jgi:hypothetical protein